MKKVASIAAFMLLSGCQTVGVHQQFNVEFDPGFPRYESVPDGCRVGDAMQTSGNDISLGERNRIASQTASAQLKAVKASGFIVLDYGWVQVRPSSPGRSLVVDYQPVFCAE